MTEEWKSIPGFEGLYEASSFGRIRSMLAHPKGRTPALHVLTPTLHANGYLNVGLRRDGRRKVVGVHRLVCAAFHGEPGEGQEARHLDNDPSHNTASNLRWGTHAENVQDMVRAGNHFSANRDRTHCRRNHAFTDENTYRNAGRRICRTCSRDKARRWRASKNDTTNKEQS